MHILVIDDVAVLRSALAGILAREPGIAAVATAATSASALEQLAVVGCPTVAVLNMAMHDGMCVLREIGGTVPVIALGVPDEPEQIIDCAEAGAAGFLFRGQPLTELVSLLECVTQGETQLSPSVAATLLRHIGRPVGRRGADVPAVRLTPRERQVLDLVDQGMSNKQIARRLCIELRTVKNHVHHILEKYQVHRRADAVDRFRAASADSAGTGPGLVSNLDPADRSSDQSSGLR